MSDRPKLTPETLSGIADKIVPEYRRPGANYSCAGTVARRWQAAWDAACVASGGNPADYIIDLDVRARTRWIKQQPPLD